MSLTVVLKSRQGSFPMNLLEQAHSMPLLPPASHHSSLRPHEEVIRVLRVKNYSLERIARWLQHHGVPATKGQVMHILRRRGK